VSEIKLIGEGGKEHHLYKLMYNRGFGDKKYIFYVIAYSMVDAKEHVREYLKENSTYDGFVREFFIVDSSVKLLERGVLVVLT